MTFLKLNSLGNARRSSARNGISYVSAWPWTRHWNQAQAFSGFLSWQCYSRCVFVANSFQSKFYEAFLFHYPVHTKLRCSWRDWRTQTSVSLVHKITKRKSKPTTQELTNFQPHETYSTPSTANPPPHPPSLDPPNSISAPNPLGSFQPSPLRPRTSPPLRATSPAPHPSPSPSHATSAGSHTCTPTPQLEPAGSLARLRGRCGAGLAW